MELIWQAINFDGLPLLILAVCIAGLVRGFAGFGSAMVFVPIAATTTSPIWTIIIMMSFEFVGTSTLLPKALREGEMKDVSLLGVGALIGLPIGVFFLTLLDPVIFRWIVSVLALTMLAILASGWRYKKPLDAMLTTLVGLTSGFLTGIAALPGPPVIISYMSSPRPPAIIRANSLLYLFLVDVILIVVFLIKGLFVLFPVLVGLILAVPYAVSGAIGQRIFDPENERNYRLFAYVLIALSAISGLPVWG